MTSVRKRAPVNHCSAAHSAIVERSLAKDPAARYPSVREFREALRPFRRETAGG
jgi:hypothetical protein